RDGAVQDRKRPCRGRGGSPPRPPNVRRPAAQDRPSPVPPAKANTPSRSALAACARERCELRPARNVQFGRWNASCHAATILARGETYGSPDSRAPVGLAPQYSGARPTIRADSVRNRDRQDGVEAKP